MKENKNWTSNGKGREYDSSQCSQPQTTKRGKKIMCTLEQGKSRIQASKERTFLEKKKEARKCVFEFRLCKDFGKIYDSSYSLSLHPHSSLNWLTLILITQGPNTLKTN